METNTNFREMRYHESSLFRNAFIMLALDTVEYKQQAEPPKCNSLPNCVLASTHITTIQKNITP